MSKVQEALAVLKAQQARDKEVDRDMANDQEPASEAPNSIEAPHRAPENVVLPADRCIKFDTDLLRAEGLLATEDSARQVVDQFRNIKRPILKLALGQTADIRWHSNLVMVASALAGDGKTFNTINLALSIANEKDISVILVDADVGKPHISRLLGLAEEPGFVDLLRKGETDLDLVRFQTDVPGLSIIPAGQQYDYATELLASNRMADAVSRLANGVPNRIVIFDSPPILQTSESRVLASRMGQIVLVVCADKTPRPAVVAAIESLDTDKPVNLILNQAGFMFSSDAYGAYAYGYGSSQ